MRLKLDKIGIIEDSEIDINGLTVITGRNNSGKSTVGKTLYSLVQAVCNIDEKIENEKYGKLRDAMFRVSDFFPMSFSSYVELLKDNPEYHNLVSFFEPFPPSNVARTEMETYLESVASQLNSLNINIDLITKKTLLKWAEHYKEKNFEQDREKALRFLNKSLDDYRKKENVIDYVKKYVMSHLLLEFSGQIHPIAQRESEASIELKNEERTFFSLKIKDGKLIGTEKIFEYKPYGNVFFIDSPFILDDIEVSRYGLRRIFRQNVPYIVGHQTFLKRALNSATEEFVYDQSSLDNSCDGVLEMFLGAIQGRIQKNERGAFYKDINGNELKLENLATGSKMLLILKQLIECSKIHPDTLLILDEPEAHLHPEWQNLFAEIIVRLVKDVGCHIVLTTHSINFMLALDAFSKKYKITDKTDFYSTQIKQNHFVSYEKLTNQKEKIYEDFAQWFSKMKRLHDSLEGE